MTIEVVQDPKRPAGFALMDVAAALPDGPVPFTISRDHPSKPWLGPSGWQATPAALTARDVSYTESGARFALGPEIVNHIPEFEQVVVALTDVGLRSDVVWPEIPPLRTASGHAPVHVDAPKPAPVPAPPPPPRPAPVEEKPEPSDTDLLNEVETSERPTDTIDEPHDDDIEDDDGDSDRKRFSFVQAALVLLLLVGVGGAAVWYFWPPDGAPDERPLPQPPVDPRTVILDPNTSTEELIRIGRDLTERDADPDFELGFEAFTRAAGRGAAEAALWIGRAYDPRGDLWRDVFETAPSAIAALRSYRDAVAAGSDEAAQEIDGLCGYLADLELPGDEDRFARENYCGN